MPGGHIALIEALLELGDRGAGAAVPGAGPVLKRELTWIPFVGWGIRQLRAIAVDRSGGPAAVRDVIAQGKKRLAQGVWVVIFPEGTRMPPGETRRYGVSGALLAVETTLHRAGGPRCGLLLAPARLAQAPRHHTRDHRAANRPRGTQSARDQSGGAGVDRGAFAARAVTAPTGAPMRCCAKIGA